MSGKRHIIITRIIGLLVFAIIAIPVTVQIPAVQTFLLRKATTLLEEVLDGKVSIGGIQVKLGGAIAIRDLIIVDSHPYSDDLHTWDPVDTLANIGLITGTCKIQGLLKHEGIHLGRIHVQDGFFHLVSEPTDYKSNISRLLGVKPIENPPPQEKNPVFDIRRIRLDNIRFKMNNYIVTVKDNDLRSPYGVHFEDMDACVEKMRVNNLRFAYGRMSGILKDCRISEKRGYCLNSLKAKFAVGTGLITIQDIHLLDKWSDVTLDQVTMDFKKGAKAFMRFITDVNLAVSTDNGGHLDIRTISGICGALYENESVYELKRIRAEGSINKINVKTLEFKELNTGLSGALKCKLGGLPDIQKFTLDGEIKNVAFTPVNGCRFTAYWAKNFKLHIPGEQKFLLNGSVHGLLRNLKINIDFSSAECGTLKGEILIKNIQDPQKRPITIDGFVSTHDLAAGKICGIDNLGNVSLSSNAFLELAGASPNMKIDSLRIGKLGFNGYEYSELSAEGFKQGDHLLAHVVSRDPAITFNLLTDCSGKRENNDLSVKLAADIEKADMAVLGLDKRSSGTSLLSSSVDARLESFGKETLQGKMAIEDLILTNEEGPQKIGDITASLLHGKEDKISVTSNFAEINYEGSAGIGQMLDDLKALSVEKELPNLFNNSKDKSKKGKYHTQAIFLDTKNILAFLLPEAYIQEGTQFTIDADSSTVKANLSSGRLAMGVHYLKDISLHADNLENKLSANVNVDEISALGMKFEKSKISAMADSNLFSIGMCYAVKDRDTDSGNITFNGGIERDENDSLLVRVFPSNASLTIGGEIWKWGESEISFGSGKMDFNNFMISSGDRMLKINGGVSKNTLDTIKLELKGIGLDMMKKVMETGPDMQGNLSGYATLISPLKGQYKVLGKIACDSISINGMNAGDMTLAGKWDERKQAINAFLENRKDGKRTLTSYAFFDPLKKNIQAEASMDGLCPSLAVPLLPGVLDEVGGAISGKIKVEGPVKDLKISTDKLTLDKLLLKISSTGVAYTLDGPLTINEKGLNLDNISLSDGFNGKGKFHGNINFSGLDKVSLNAGVDFSELFIINCTEKAGQSFYGKLAGSGNASINGPISRLNINARLATIGDGQVHIPLGSSITSTNSDLLTFVQKKKEMDEYEAMISSKKKDESKSSGGDLSINASITATPGVKAIIEIDKSTGNLLSAYGEGTVKAFIRPSKGILNLEGKYNITGGEYHFQTAAIISKEFTIQNGSSLSFNGPVKDSKLDVTALYNLKTSLNTLIADSSSVNSRRAVQCGLHISDKISNLKFDFSINVPDLEPSTKARVESALNTEDKVQRQFASLLVLGTFVPSEQSGVVNSKNMLYSNVSEMMSSQINSIFQKLDIPVDLGFGYQQNEGGTDIFDVAISTQLFNNRVVINGSVGNRKYKTSTNPYGDVVGDLDIEIKLDKKGLLRGTLFSHSADEYSNFLDYSQRNGVGISYQMEYDRFKYLFMKKGKSEPQEKGDSLKVIHIQSSPESKRSR